MNEITPKEKEAIVLYRSYNSDGQLYGWRYMGAYLPKKAAMVAVLALGNGAITAIHRGEVGPTTEVEDVLIAQFAERLLQSDLDVVGGESRWDGLSAPVLARILSGRKQLSLADVVANIDDNVAWLRTGPEVGSDAQIRICEVLKTAPLADLVTHRSECGALVRELNAYWRYELLSTSPDRWHFWCQMLEQALSDVSENA